MRDLPLTVRAKNRTECEVLSPATCVIWSTFYVTWAVNQSWELHVTLMDDSSLAYELADIEGSIFFDNQEYIIKQCGPDYNLGANTKELTCTHVYNQLSQIRKTESNEDEKTYSLEDVLNFFLDGNKLGFSYEIHGAFENQRIQGLGNGSGMDMLSQITSTWPKSVIFPRNRVIRIYDEDSFYHDYGNRIDYLHDTKEVKLTIDSTSLTNIVYCVGGTHTVEETTTTTEKVAVTTDVVTGTGAQAVIDDAKSYLGVPYKWGGAGGARGGDPRSGMDCSSFVSQVYKDFGISIPAYTVSMESYGHEISRSEVQTGDMGFYGSHGASYHICMALDNQTMIYEPQPGEVCKTQSINSYPPTWWIRNDQMAAKVGEVSTSQQTSYQDVEHSETEEKEVNYFEPFTYRDEESIAEWGEYPAEPIEDERFHDENAMREYAKSQLQTSPNMAVEVTMDTNSKPEAGETRLLKVQNTLMTRVKVVGYTWYPYDVNTATTLNLDDIPLTVLNQNGKIDALTKELQEQAKRTADELRARILNQRQELSRLNSLPKVYYSGEDPSNTESVKAGDLWFEY
ncbi:phage tail protein [Ligilactobacillus equi]